MSKSRIDERINLRQYSNQNIIMTQAYFKYIRPEPGSMIPIKQALLQSSKFLPCKMTRPEIRREFFIRGFSYNSQLRKKVHGKTYQGFFMDCIFDSRHPEKQWVARIEAQKSTQTQPQRSKRKRKRKRQAKKVWKMDMGSFKKPKQISKKPSKKPLKEPSKRLNQLSKKRHVDPPGQVVPIVKPPILPSNRAPYKQRVNVAIARLCQTRQFRKVLVIDDPQTKNRTTRVLRELCPTIRVDAMSWDPLITKSARMYQQHGARVFCGISTDILSQIGEEDEKYDAIFLDYCDTPLLKSTKPYHWTNDLKLIFDGILSPKGMTFLTFSKRNFPFVRQFVDTTLRNDFPQLRIADVYDYYDSTNMAVFTIVRHVDYPSGIGGIAQMTIPKRGERVYIAKDGNIPAWMGDVSSMNSFNSWTIFSPEDDKTHEVPKQFIFKI